MFVNSLPILFVYIKFASPVEYLFVILFVLLLLYIVTPSNPSFKDITWSSISELSFYRYLFDSWTGQVKLWLVFWPFFVFLNFGLYFTDKLAKGGHLTVFSWDEIHLILLTPVIFWTISVWRNSLNTSSRYWAILARFMTLSVYFEYGLKLVLRQNYARIFFECNEVMLDYASCF